MTYENLLACLKLFETDTMLYYKLAKEYDITPAELEQRYKDCITYWTSVVAHQQPVLSSLQYEQKLINLTASFCTAIIHIRAWRNPVSTNAAILLVMECTTERQQRYPIDKYLGQVRRRIEAVNFGGAEKIDAQ